MLLSKDIKLPMPVAHRQKVRIQEEAQFWKSGTLFFIRKYPSNGGSIKKCTLKSGSVYALETGVLYTAGMTLPPMRAKIEGYYACSDAELTTYVIDGDSYEATARDMIQALRVMQVLKSVGTGTAVVKATVQKLILALSLHGEEAYTLMQAARYSEAVLKCNVSTQQSLNLLDDFIAVYGLETHQLIEKVQKPLSPDAAEPVHVLKAAMLYAQGLSIDAISTYGVHRDVVEALKTVTDENYEFFISV